MITTYGYSGSKIPRYPKIKIISDIGILTGSRKFRRGQFCRMTVLAKLSSGETIRLLTVKLSAAKFPVTILTL